MIRAQANEREIERKIEWYMTNVNCCLPIDEFRKSLWGNDKRPRNMFHAQIVDKMKGMFLHCTMNYCTHMTSDSHSVHNSTHWMDRQFQKRPKLLLIKTSFFYIHHQLLLLFFFLLFTLDCKAVIGLTPQLIRSLLFLRFKTGSYIWYKGIWLLQIDDCQREFLQ